MSNDEWVQLLQNFPRERQPKLILVLKNGTELNTDILVRYEPEYLVMRGRVGGQTEEGRAFFIPYDQLLYLRLEDGVKLDELYGLYGEVPEFDERGNPIKKSEPEPQEPAKPRQGPGRSSGTVDKLLQRINASSGNGTDRR